MLCGYFSIKCFDSKNSAKEDTSIEKKGDEFGSSKRSKSSENPTEFDSKTTTSKNVNIFVTGDVMLNGTSKKCLSNNHDIKKEDLPSATEDTILEEVNSRQFIVILLMALSFILPITT